MLLPIDARRRPFTPKYIDEETPLLSRWVMFGTVTGGAEHVPRNCVADANGDDIIIGLTVPEAMRLVRARDAFIDEVLRVLNKTPPEQPLDEP